MKRAALCLVALGIMFCEGTIFLNKHDEGQIHPCLWVILFKKLPPRNGMTTTMAPTTIAPPMTETPGTSTAAAETTVAPTMETAAEDTTATAEETTATAEETTVTAEETTDVDDTAAASVES